MASRSCETALSCARGADVPLIQVEQRPRHLDPDQESDIAAAPVEVAGAGKDLDIRLGPCHLQVERGFAGALRALLHQAQRRNPASTALGLGVSCPAAEGSVTRQGRILGRPEPRRLRSREEDAHVISTYTMTETATPKQQLFEHLALIGRALGHAARLELLDYLAQGERSVEELVRLTGLSVANTSKHLQQLKAAGLADARREGKYIRYRLADDRVLDAIAALRGIAADQSDAVGTLLDSYLTRRDALEPVPAQELLERARDGLVTVLDVRPAEEFAQGHLPGAINIPLERLKERLAELPADRRVVAYCRGPWCVLSFEAVAELRGAGFDARRLENGLPEWRRAGLPLARGGVD
jgi:rhodanese-related sulfurtransferase/DNA-binding transcriptional ArsR family regulator